MLVFVMVFLLLDSHVAATLTNGAQPLGIAMLQPYEVYCARHMCLLVMVHGP